MTIIEPYKKGHFYAYFFYIGAILFVGAIASISLYNANVRLKYDISVQEKALQQLETANADFQNQLHQLLDAGNLNSIVARQSLVSEKNPQYLEVKSLAAF
ncbi:MAG: hypothetical protein A3B16_02845 [Candidatus Zambryskibacteria bacterium RIFCSPLOWO2_01_FULL_45_43]|uniref:Uncharacterized protein n=2 Tax=Parcubacteria group TaxID=1794811 RepID=A0A1G1ZV00_9BACT|nr:MAG: hypothetical protein A3H63_00645 [Candidatus Harrisonbacteria bacterium RIFCSPLOWO2_02_FULL_45_10c]OHB06214.1 MAG: hypothetical protein A3B16_02845 [Candidatus Zambryskibacteria bacterium RIFCSPLOWO2_01_FULL_45_43]